MASASPSPKSPELSEKSKRYDRQLRLWGDHGQTKLETSKICLVNANATGTEILKSLILPGCGSFTILDHQTVRMEDVGNNFFLDSESIGKNRGESARQYLLELNRDVSGEAIDDQPENILDQDPNFFKHFSVVVASQLTEKELLLLSKRLWEDDIPFIYCQVVGLVGWIRLQFREHTIIETHPDNIVEDLRLDSPFPELVEYMKSIEVISREEGALKTPWLVLLYKALEQWREVDSIGQNKETIPMELDTKNGYSKGMGQEQGNSTKRFPSLSKEKQEFKKFLRNYLEELGLHDGDENFEESIKAVNSSLSRTKVPDSILGILDDNSVDHPRNSFWVMCSGLRQFVKLHGCLPVRGSIPDMTADSAKYISLQTVYREKSIRDSDEIYTYCQPLLQQAGLQKVKLTLDDVCKFCKEANYLRLIRGSPIYEELSCSPVEICNELCKHKQYVNHDDSILHSVSDLAHNLEENEEADKFYYILFRGILKFHGEYNTYPGALQTFESDITRFKAVLSKLLNEWNTSLVIKDDLSHEIVRYGGSEIPSIAGFVGASVAQEIIKLITTQYVPLNNSLIYNAINSTTTSFTI